MSTAGIIAEFDPFHSGHKYLIDTSKKITGADSVIVVCSGNYVQRGTPSFFPKNIRAAFAIENGADAVLELPVIYSTASAELFAQAAVRFLDKLNCVDYLVFGCENDDLKLLNYAAEIFVDEPEIYKNELNAGLRSGLSYPAAREEAICSFLNSNSFHNSTDTCLNNALLEDDKATNKGIKSRVTDTDMVPFLKPEAASGSISSDDIHNIISRPNNILAIEYLKALKKFSSKIIPVAIKRVGTEYKSDKTKGPYPSSTSIRNEIQQGNITNFFDLDIPKNIPDISHFMLADDYSDILAYALTSFSSSKKHQSYERIYGINRDLSKRINSLLCDYNGYTSFINLLKTKNTTYSGISRALLHLVLNIDDNMVQHAIDCDYIDFCIPLGINKKSGILKNIKENSHVKIISKMADIDMDHDTKLGKILELNINADRLYSMIYRNKFDSSFPDEIKRQIYTKE